MQQTLVRILTFCWSRWSSMVFLNCSARRAMLCARSCFSFFRASRCSAFDSFDTSSRCVRYRFSSVFTASWNWRRKSCSIACRHAKIHRQPVAGQVILPHQYRSQLFFNVDASLWHPLGWHPFLVIFAIVQQLLDSRTKSEIDHSRHGSAKLL